MSVSRTIHSSSVYKTVRRAFCRNFPQLATEILFFKWLGYPYSRNNPESLNQKLQWLKLNVYSGNQLISDCIDKYKVRDYVRNAGGGNLLTKLYGVWERPEDIPWESLPNRFVLKCNHGSGYNLVCRDLSSFDRGDAVKKLAGWMKDTSYGELNAELLYSGITPRIICEEFIETEDGLPPKDYKIFCSYGEPKLIFVAQDRYEGKTKFDYYDPYWNWIDVRNGHPNAKKHLEKPEFLQEMLSAAGILSKPFPLVRCDFYHENGRLIFGELTFLHFGGFVPFDPKQKDFEFGEMFPLDIGELKKNGLRI